MNCAVRKVKFAQRGEARKSLEPRIGYPIISFPFAMVGIVAVVKVDRSRHIENLYSGVAGREVKPLRTARRTDDGLAADVLDVGLKRERTTTQPRSPFDVRQECRYFAAQVAV